MSQTILTKILYHGGCLGAAAEPLPWPFGTHVAGYSARLHTDLGVADIDTRGKYSLK